MVLMSPEEHYYKVDNMVLSSSPYLRKLFQSRWKKETGKDWEHTEAQGKEFIEGLGKSAHKKAGKLQKRVLASGCLDTWDISTLSLVLQSFGNPIENKSENEAVQGLTRLRNYLSHHPNKKLTTEVYNENVETIKDCLRKINVEENIINKIEEKAGMTSSIIALESAKKLLKKAERFAKKGNFEKAMESYDDATTMPSLLPFHLGNVFEKRAGFYLNQAQNHKENHDETQANNYCELALKDGTAALELNDNSWKAHYLIGQCHKWKKNFDKAIQHYNSAMAISPIQKDMKKEVDVCKSLAGAAFRSDNIDPRNTPMSLKERVEQVNDASGCKQTEAQFLFERGPLSGEVVKGQDDVSRGHQYLGGWDVPQNYKKAAECYAKAAEKGNPEGIYNLGVCYAKGKGMPLDLTKAYEYYLRAANMSPDTLGMVTAAKKNVGVASAQHAIGEMYENGIEVEQDYVEAAIWYTTAAENGMGSSANNLALLYMNGLGVPRNVKKGEMYWNQAVILKDPNAAASLVYFYIEHFEPTKAEAMFKTGKALGHVGLQDISDEEFKLMASSSFAVRKDLEKAVEAFEDLHGLDIKGLTFLERNMRLISYQNPNMKEFFSAANAINSMKGSGGTIDKSDPFNEELFKKAAVGSLVARKILKTQMLSIQLTNFLLAKENFSDDEMNSILELAYECCTLELHASLIPREMEVASKLKRVIGHLFHTKCDGSESDDDMKIRLCYVSINLISAMETPDDFGFEILKQGLRMYPDNFHYYHLISSVCGLKNDTKSGLHYAEKGLEKFPDEVELLYSKAVHLRSLLTENDEESTKKVIVAYTAFLSHAPKEHRKVPESYYALASLHIPQTSSTDRMTSLDDKDAVKKMKYYYKLGKESESSMLPCYLPYKKSGVQSLVKLIVQALPTPQNTESKAVQENILEKKQYLADPERKRLILQHRNKFKGWKTMVHLTPKTTAPKLTQTTPQKISGMTAITLKEMNPTSDFIYENRMIELTIIEDPFFGMPSIHLVAEDENGDATRLYIYNVGQNKEAEENLGFGCKVAILNPYLRIGSQDETNGIRNDDPNCLMYLEKAKSMCRFCGEEKALKSCRRCKRAGYCSRQCLEKDRKIMKHKLICSNLQG